MSNLNLFNLESETLPIQSEEDAVSKEVRQNIGYIALNLFGPEHGIDLKLPQYSAYQSPDLSE